MNKQALLLEKERLSLFFESGKTKRWDFRMRQLSALEKALLLRKKDFYAALKEDLNKSAYEASMAELGIVLGELAFARKNLRRWMAPKKVKASLPQLPGKAVQYPEPYGVVLILSPWNYPLQLSLNPLIAALAAGNCVVLKPSGETPRTSRLLKEVLEAALPDTVAVVEGGREENTALFELPFDYLFFTGSTKVGKAAMKAAAEHLTPVTLELGGKSPAIVDESANLEKTAKRLLFGKLLNAGQTCVAPDYLWVHEKVKAALVEELIRQAGKMLIEGHEEQWVRIVSDKHRKRLEGYLEGQTILWQHATSQEQGHFPLTLVDEPSWDSPLMQEEIFGPIWPVLSFSSIDEVIEKQKTLEKPLALYLFTKSRQATEKVLGGLSFGGGCVNDTLMHLTSSHLPFGGVGASGMGSYHGKAGFDTFTHYKGIHHKGWFFDLPIRYFPYKKPQRDFFMRLLR